MAMAFTLSGSLPAISQTAPPKLRTTQTAATQPSATPSIAAPKSRKPKASAPRAGGGTGHVYLLRGLLNIFSLGMDDLAAKLQARGVAATVHNHADWQGIADDIAAKYKAGKHGPVILIGHSLGADAVMIHGRVSRQEGRAGCARRSVRRHRLLRREQQCGARDESHAARLCLHETRHRLPRHTCRISTSARMPRSITSRSTSPHVCTTWSWAASSAFSVAAAALRKRRLVRRMSTGLDRKHCGAAGRTAAASAPAAAAAAPKAQ